MGLYARCAQSASAYGEPKPMRMLVELDERCGRRADAYDGPSESRGQLLTGNAAADGLQLVPAWRPLGASDGNRRGRVPAAS